MSRSTRQPAGGGDLQVAIDVDDHGSDRGAAVCSGRQRRLAERVELEVAGERLQQIRTAASIACERPSAPINRLNSRALSPISSAESTGTEQPAGSRLGPVAGFGGVADHLTPTEPGATIEQP